MNKNCLKCNKEFRVRLSWARVKFCSSRCYWDSMKGQTTSENQKMAVRNNRGEKHYRWMSDRSKLKKKQERNDSAYHEWRKSVRDRDGWQCKMSNSDCLGKVVAHHILSWSKFPDLRYEINNGITLCRFHHPRKRDDEIRLSPYFQSMLEVKLN